MKVVLAGAFGNLGAEILKCLCADGNEVVAADLRESTVEGCEGKYTFRAIDATNPETMKGLCDGADAVITTVGLTGASTKVTSYDMSIPARLPPGRASTMLQSTALVLIRLAPSVTRSRCRRRYFTITSSAAERAILIARIASSSTFLHRKRRVSVFPL